MKQKIGYPDYLNDSRSVDYEYRMFKVYDGGYYKTKFQFYEQYQRDVLERIAQPVDRERWVAGAALVNAFYSPNTNEINNGGLKQAYKAYKKYEKSHKHPPRLPGVNLTHDQLFFLNYAQIIYLFYSISYLKIWCGTMNDKEAVRKLRTSEHSPGPIRVKGPLSNSLDFAKAYNCPVGSPMNPHHKCRVW
uniref:Peptidase_M13 domain-containing protein n=1 Tax=Heterorhabditis bacteriophora TaxID=37862 RepID=A0A1I7XUK0_HETBA